MTASHVVSLFARRIALRAVMVVLVMVCVVPPAALRAQEMGSAAGMVRAADGTPVINARVTLAGARIVRSTRSDARGAFTIDNLPPGTYALRAIGDGYAEVFGRTIDVTGGAATPVDVVLQRASPASLIVIGDVRSRGRDALSTSSAPSVNLDAQQYAARGEAQMSQVVNAALSTTVLHPLGGSLNLPALVSLRGPDPSETLVDVDGFQLNNGVSGDFDLSLLDPADFQNVQIVYGIAPSSLVGPDTLGGAINIRTLEPTTTPHSLLRFSVGSFDTFGATVQATGTGNRLGYAFSLRRLTSKGEVSGLQVQDAQGDVAGIGSALAGSNALAKMHYSFGRAGGYAEFTVRDQSAYRDLSAALTGIQDGSYQPSNGSALQSHNAGYGVAAQIPLGARTDGTEYTTATIRHSTSVVSNSVVGPAVDTSAYLYNMRDLINSESFEIDRQLVRSSISLKLETRNERAATDFAAGTASDQSLGRRPEVWRRMFDVSGSSSSNPLDLGQVQQSAALKYTLDPTPKLHYAFAAYYSNFSTFGTSLDPRFGFTWTPDARSVLRFSLGSTFQAPQLTSLFVPSELPPPVNGYVSVGNPALRPDRATEYDLGYQHVFGAAPDATHVSLDLYRTNLRTPISIYFSPTPCTSNNQDPATCLSFPINAGGAVYQGLELRIARDLSSNTTLRFGYDVDSAFLTTVPAELRSGTLVANEQILGAPLHKMTLDLQHDDARVTYYAGLLYEGRYNALNRDPFATLQAGLTWHAGGLDLGLSGTNLTNTYADRFTHIDEGVPYGGSNGPIPTSAYALPARAVTFTVTRRM